MLEVRNLHAGYTDAEGHAVKAVQGISFDVPEGTLFTLLGPSGCGKTTTMRSIAGLERPTAGEVVVNGRCLYSASRRIFTPPNRRNFGMVFQSYAIWPHLSVFDNAAFPLHVGKRRRARAEVRETVMRVLHVVGLDHLAERDATALSGGQQQRLALARALAMEPELLLLDEPLSNLDAKLRERMRTEIKRLQNEYGLTTIYVTHDQGEALSLSHSIAVISEGRIAQIGSPRDIYERPANPFVADFVGSTNLVQATVESLEPDGAGFAVQSGLGRLRVNSSTAVCVGDAVLLSIRPEDVALVALAPVSPGGPNVLEAIVDSRIFLGEAVDYQVRVGEQRLLVRAHPSVDLAVGATVRCCIEPGKCTAIGAGG